MKLHLQIMKLEPATEEKGKGKENSELINVYCATSLTPEQYSELKELTTEWGFEVETKDKGE